MRVRRECAAVRFAGREPVFATAPERASGWLLVEHPGPWPPVGPPHGVPPDFWAAAGEAGLRTLCIRPVRRRRSSPVTVFAAGPAGGWLERAVIGDLRELAGLDLEALAAGRPPGFGTRGAGKVVLVCTHGRRDVCCARLGRPLAERLDERLPGLVWEATHVGGHRYAANVVTVPDGRFHGGLTAADAAEFAAAVRDGRVLTGFLRGRAGLRVPVQAAEHFTRVRFGLSGVDDVIPVGDEVLGDDGAVRVRLSLADGSPCTVDVRPRPLGKVRPASCAGAVTAPRTFDLLALRGGAPGGQRAG
ncbi:sucrase ferredoxin [Amycolatopsis acidicola]|uniref:Sucrase ferredoxin n=1 Tax=Amycolatopsis acidicola TaxID=2596893 RepID=A0A5N0UUF7_9PSEU|nr:sucrase ferredoxin [Amycolatopsis acidicola]KAA9156226.1 sucrase ferredoxin [Amycolatopsis acidicola]